MSAQDRFARAWDASGITALYSDLFYQTLHTSLALGGPNITNGIIAPKFPQKPSFLEQKLQESTGIIGLDATANMAGAGVSISLDLLGGAAQFILVSMEKVQRTLLVIYRLLECGFGKTT